jgi:hypothetical protein
VNDLPCTLSSTDVTCWASASHGLAGAATTACGSSPSVEERRDRPNAPQRDGDDRRRILLAYFSRPGENYWYGGRRDLRAGNTEVLAGMIAERLRCDVHRIRAAEPCADDYDEAVTRNVREQAATPGRRSPTRCRRSAPTRWCCSPARPGTSARR